MYELSSPICPEQAFITHLFLSQDLHYLLAMCITTYQIELTASIREKWFLHCG